MILQSKNVGNYIIYFQNKEEFEKIYTENFINEDYKFLSKNNTPFIIDCGSHIGIPILYFKKNIQILEYWPSNQIQ